MRASDNPIHTVSWTRDFIPALGKIIIQGCTHGPLEDAVVILPHRRAARYLTDVFKKQAEQSKAPLLPPTMLALEDFISWGLRRVAAPETLRSLPMRTLSRLDQAFALHKVVDALPGLFQAEDTERTMDMNRFLPWGMRLAGVMEDFFRQDLVPANLDHVGDEVAPYAAMLLGSLGDVFTKYEQLLESNGWTTPGLQCRTLARQAHPLADSLKDKDVFIAGFYALTGCENTFFNAMWQHGARVIWHGDTQLCRGRKGHWACCEHANWAKRWATVPECSTEPKQASVPPVRFIEGFDRHSQLAALQTELADAVSTDGTAAVVLPDTGLLAPLLRHLPDKDVNISMGYPLERSALFALLDLVMELHLQRETNGEYPWERLSEIVRHPFCGQIGAQDGDFPLRPLLRAMDRVLREAGRDISLNMLVQTALDHVFNEQDSPVSKQVRELLTHWLDAFFHAYEGRNTLTGLAEALRRTTTLLLEGCAPVWRQRLIDAECLYRTLIETVPMLSSGIGKDQELAPEVLYPLARQVMCGQSVSFEPEPLTGLQVLGILETRLLSFERLFVLDATEDKLPGSSDHDPLLPNTLRLHLGLPHSRERDNVSAYNFYRLLMSCREAVICYPKGEHQGILDGSHLRSRFVEQLLWEQEKQIHRVLDPDTDPVFTRKHFSLPSLSPGPEAIEAGPEARNRIEELVLQKGVSATMLDTYMRCPKRFFQQYVLRLQALEQADPGGDKRAFGELVHQVLRTFFEEHKGEESTLSELPQKELQQAFTTALEQSDFFSQMAPDAKALLRLVGRERLAQFLQKQPTATIHALEQRMSTLFALTAPDGSTIDIKLYGTIDRCDERESPHNGMYILDYKTGQPVKPSSAFWVDDSLWRDMELACPGTDPAPDLLQRVADATGSVQLPLYCTIYNAARNKSDAPLVNAGWINLAKDGEEIFLFSAKCELETRFDIMEHRFPVLLAYLLRHLLFAKKFEPIPSKLCDWCDFAGTCRQ